METFLFAIGAGLAGYWLFMKIFFWWCDWSLYRAKRPRKKLSPKTINKLYILTMIGIVLFIIIIALEPVFNPVIR